MRNGDVVLNECLRFVRKDLGLEGFEHEDEAGVRIAALVSAVVAFDVEDGFFPSFDGAAVQLLLGFLDAFDVADCVPLDLGLLEAIGQFGAAGEFDVELALADAFTLDGGMGVAALYEVFDYAFKERVGEFATTTGRAGLFCPG